MEAIITYNNAKKELEIAEIELQSLLDKKDLLYSKYFKITSTISNVSSKNSSYRDKFQQFMIEYTKIDKDKGMSLEQEIKYQKELVNKLQYRLDQMTVRLVELQGIEYELYSQIVVKSTSSGKRSISKAVEKTAELYNVSEKTVWRCYNEKIKKILKMSVKCP